MDKARTLVYILLIIGIADSLYLTVQHYASLPLICPKVAGFVDCENVVQSSFSVVFGIPLAVYGLIWMVVFLLLVHFNVKWIDIEIWGIFGLGGFLYSVVAMYLLGKICLYCTLMDIIIIMSVFVAVAFKHRVFHNKKTRV